MARHLYGLDPWDPRAPLARMFVPEAEVRFSDDGLLLRALDGDALGRLRRSCLDSVLPAVKGRRGGHPPGKLDLPEVAAHDADIYSEAVAAAIGEIRRHDYRKVILSRRVPISRSIDMARSFGSAQK